MDDTYPVDSENPWADTIQSAQPFGGRHLPKGTDRPLAANGSRWLDLAGTHPNRAPSVTYGLTDKGKDFDAVLKAFETVAAKWEG